MNDKIVKFIHDILVDNCGVVNNADSYNKLNKEWHGKIQEMYMSMPPRYANPLPTFICVNRGEEI
jgi:hypothetical protein